MRRIAINLNAVFPYVTLIIALVATAALLGQTFRVSHNTSAFNNLKATAEGWEGRARLLEAEQEDLKIQNAEQAKQIAELQGREATLRDMVTGRAAIDQMSREIRSLVQANEKRSANVLAEISSARSEIQAVDRFVRQRLKGDG